MENVQVMIKSKDFSARYAAIEMTETGNRFVPLRSDYKGSVISTLWRPRSSYEVISLKWHGECAGYDKVQRFLCSLRCDRNDESWKQVCSSSQWPKGFRHLDLVETAKPLRSNIFEMAWRMCRL